jgi:DHA1 family bicyclomycin/chloramphenicol resistance-like MFS transporter
MIKIDGLSELKIFLFVILAVIAGLLGIDIHLASMPHIMTFMHTDKEHISQSISFFLLGVGIGMLVLGPLSDKFGRKIILLTGLGLTIITNIASVKTSHVNYFLIQRFFQGFGSSACLCLGRVILADIVERDRYAVVASYLTVITGLSPLVAPIIGSYIQLWFDWQTNFLLLAILQLMLFISVIAFFPETNKYKNKYFTSRKLLSNYMVIIRNNLFIGFTLLSGIGLSVNMLYATLGSFIFQNELNIDIISFGWITMIMSLGIVLSRFSLPILVNKITFIKTILIGLILLFSSGIALLSLSVTGHANLFFLESAIFLTLFSYPLIVICSSTGAITSFDDKRGAAGALYGGFQMLLAFVISAIAGGASFNSLRFLALSYFLLGILGLILYFPVMREYMKIPKL